MVLSNLTGRRTFRIREIERANLSEPRSRWLNARSDRAAVGNDNHGDNW